MYTRKAWHGVLSHYCIDNSTTENHHPHQNPAKREIQDLKNNVNHIMDHTYTPTFIWLRCIILWLCCWIMLQCPPLVGGKLLRFPWGLFQNFLHLTSLSCGSSSINHMIMDQGLQIIRRYWDIGVYELKTVAKHWNIGYVPQIESIWL